MPGTRVAMGLYGPRTPSGASGLRSKLSMWLAPPYCTMKMHDLSDDSAAPASPQQPRQAEAEHADAADLQQLAAVDRAMAWLHGSPSRDAVSTP